MASLTHKIALVTGATWGIGYAIAEQLASIGARVVIHGLRESDAREAAGRLGAAGHEAGAVGGDLTDPATCRAIVRHAVEWGGGLDVLVNNAGYTARGRLEDASLEFWELMMAVNVRAPFLCMQEAIGPMKARGGGAVVNIGSINAYIGAPNLGPYSVSKGALMTLTRNAASALGRYGIRVNQLNVGWTLTEGEDRVQQATGKGSDWLERATALMPFGRLLTPNEVARAAAYFASDESGIVTGSVLDVEQYPMGAPAEF
jgi:NAD(P)-dependent dehydrogenase (short-subunit alcohol dehydrogenase family)